MAKISLDNPNPRILARVWPQWLAAFDVFILAMLVGLAGGWSTPYVAKFTSENSEIQVTPSEVSWIAAISGIGRIFGTIFSVIAVDKFGSKNAVLYSGIPFVLGWIVFLVTNSVSWIYVSRLISGFGMGIYYVAFPLYIGEISYPAIRGSLVSLAAQGQCTGAVMAKLIGAYTSMWIFACIAMVPSVAFVVFFYIKPQSPHYLVLKGRMTEAKRSLEWYNRGVDVMHELENIKQFTSDKKDISYIEKFREILKPVNLKPVLMVNFVFMFLQLGGIPSTAIYMEVLLKNAGVNVIKPALIVIIIGILGILSGWTATYTSDAFGRTIILGFSSFGVAVSYVMLAVNYHLIDWGYDTNQSYMQWLPIIALMTFQMSFLMGMAPVPGILTSEMFSVNIKSFASLLISINSAAWSFFTSKTYQPLVDLVTEKYVFSMYAVIILGLTALSIFVIPETKGKTLIEIQEIFSKKKNKPTATIVEKVELLPC